VAVVMSKEINHWLPGFDLRSDRVGFMVDLVALWQISSEYFHLVCQSSFMQTLCVQLSSVASETGSLVFVVPSALNYPTN
jgi:hypothetical protein